MEAFYENLEQEQRHNDLRRHIDRQQEWKIVLKAAEMAYKCDELSGRHYDLVENACKRKDLGMIGMLYKGLPDTEVPGGAKAELDMSIEKLLRP